MKSKDGEALTEVLLTFLGVEEKFFCAFRRYMHRFGVAGVNEVRLWEQDYKMFVENFANRYRKTRGDWGLRDSMRELPRNRWSLIHEVYMELQLGNSELVSTNPFGEKVLSMLWGMVQQRIHPN